MDEINLPDTFSNLERVLPENCVEYIIFVADDKLESRKLLSSLETIRKAAVQLANNLTKDYIWQRESFDLRIGKEQGLIFLQGTTDYSDNVEDEWLIVYILREVSKQFSDAWVRIWDSDGEFLLVEAVNALPKWISPKIDAYRVWINSGRLVLIPSVAEPQGKPGRLTLNDAATFLKTNTSSLYHSSDLQKEAFYRLEKYPAHIAASLHYARVFIPRKLAYIVHSVPNAIAPAVEAFYLRDPIALAAVLGPDNHVAQKHGRGRQFPPEDLIIVTVKFTRCLFAQLKSQPFSLIPPEWKQHVGPAVSATTSKTATSEDKATLQRLELGMKLTIGFELLAYNAEPCDNRSVRELVILLEDLKSDEVALPTDDEIQNWAFQEKDDDDRWMDVDFQDLERELSGRQPSPGQGTSKGSGFGDATAQADLRKMVQRLEAFLGDNSAGIDGAGFGSDDDQDGNEGGDEDELESSDSDMDSVDFDENEFTHMMREMMGLDDLGPRDTPSSAVKAKKGERVTELVVRPRQKHTANHDVLDEDEACDEDGIDAMMKQIETELNEYGVLNLDPTAGKPHALSERKVSSQRLPKSKGKEVAQSREDDDIAEQEAQDDSEDSEIVVDYNLAKNLLESFKGQAGLPGPAGNMLAMLGIHLPRDENTNDEHK